MTERVRRLAKSEYSIKSQNKLSHGAVAHVLFDECHRRRGFNKTNHPICHSTSQVAAGFVLIKACSMHINFHLTLVLVALVVSWSTKKNMWLLISSDIHPQR